MPVTVILCFIFSQLNQFPYGTPDHTTAEVIACAILGIKIMFGIMGNGWKEKNLISEGFVVSRSVEAENSKSALA